MKKKKKYALVLSGGGFKGAFQLGALKSLSENWKQITGLKSPMKFDIIAGVSVGALNGSFVAMNRLNELNELWLNKIAISGAPEIYTSEFIDMEQRDGSLKVHLDFNALRRLLFPDFKMNLSVMDKMVVLFSKNKRKQVLKRMLDEAKYSFRENLVKFKSIASNKPLQRKLEKALDRSLITNTKFLTGFVSLDSGRYHAVTQDQFASNTDFIKGVLASSAIPMVWEPEAEINFQTAQGFVSSKNNVDGGVRNISPLGDVIKLIQRDEENSEYHIFVINCSSGYIKPEDYSNKSIFPILSRAFYEISMNEIFNNDISAFENLNNLVKQSKIVNENTVLRNKQGDPLRSFETTIISPDPAFDMGNTLAVSENLIRSRFNHGAEISNRIISEKGGGS